MNQVINAMRKRVCDANQSLPKHGLVKFTWGNVSEVNRELGVIVIKPSGVDYDELTPENMVVTDLDGKILEGDLRPSSDLPTHVQLYKLVVWFTPIRQKLLVGLRQVVIFLSTEQPMQIISTVQSLAPVV